ncbi:MAG TPA: DUF6496 domain-containing protein [Dyella sp.]|uniref:DUF6496 domain-containing protein n=1 Tax=Dyella sp. TaxID=1869338 RepID=UPI002D789040|nr:DUF6496 domain-containing protein [Dyella sp.]HET6553674.1 DUF6496 domain-containing protein [Dyella sp.]
MPEARTRKAAAKDKREGKSASTQAGEYVHEEVHHVRKGKHGARSAKQAIAIGLSKARRAGVKAPVSKTAKTATKKKAAADEKASGLRKKPASKRSHTTSRALKKEGSAAASHKALSAHAKKAATKRTSASRSAAAKKAARTKGAAGRSTASKKAARTRKAHSH